MDRKHFSFVLIAYSRKTEKRRDKLRIKIMRNLLNLSISTKFCLFVSVNF